jgi:aspartate/methionine/tyrosine aminotransferase
VLAGRPAAREIADSGIAEVFNYGLRRPGLIPLWVGEGDLPTPGFIRNAATRSLAAGETFYTDQCGVPDLRAAIAAYMTRVYGQATRPYSPRCFFGTVGGMHALQIAFRLIAGSGDEVIVPTPAWPNFRGALNVAKVGMVEIAMQSAQQALSERFWNLDISTIASAITPKTRAILINSPANPTGWTAQLAELKAILNLARQHGLWIIADEIYGRLVFEGPRAASFHDILDPNDRILFVQTLSKNWAMTGWRVGWLEAPESLGPSIENLIQYSTSGVPVFIQRGAIAALEQGEAFLAHQLTRIRESRDILVSGLAATGSVLCGTPNAAFYLFCSVAGILDSRELAFRLVDEANIGVAPGSAFGSGAESFIRICFARRPEQISEATRRLRAWLVGRG